jgi:L-lactate dehydrogenase complex protein LldG
MNGETQSDERAQARVPSARDAILAAVRAALPPAVERPAGLEPFDAASDVGALAETFVAAAAAAGAEVIRSGTGDVARVLEARSAGARSVLSFTDISLASPPWTSDPHDLAGLDLAIFESTLGVAESAAVWLTTSDPIARGALFLAERVIVVVAERDLVRDLHAAYARLDVRAHPFGVFVAGPSKTADIEQALVIGAHGPKAFTVMLVGDGQRGSAP